jgi:hypothetical protein
MVSAGKIIIAVLLLAAGVAAYILFSNSEEERIKKRLRILGEIFQKEPGETLLLAASKAGKVRNYFTETSHVIVPAYHFSRDVARRDLPGYVLQARASYASLVVHFADFVISLPSESKAELSTTVVVTGKLPSGQRTRDIQEVRCRLQKIENQWFIRAVEVVQVLEK